MNEYLVEQAKKYLENAIPNTVKIHRTLYPGSADEIELNFYTDRNKQTQATQSDKDRFFTPSRILKSGNRTIVFWSDGTKTVVKRAEDEPDNDYEAFTAALGIKIFGSNSQLKKIIKEQTVVQKPKKAKDACPIDKPCEKSTVEHDQGALNDKAKKQYEEYLAADKWTCPKCGRQYHWQKNDAGRYAFCPKCQLASKDNKKA